MNPALTTVSVSTFRKIFSLLCYARDLQPQCFGEICCISLVAVEFTLIFLTNFANVKWLYAWNKISCTDHTVSVYFPSSLQPALLRSWLTTEIVFMKFVLCLCCLIQPANDPTHDLADTSVASWERNQRCKCETLKLAVIIVITRS